MYVVVHLWILDSLVDIALHIDVRVCYLPLLPVVAAAPRQVEVHSCKDIDKKVHHHGLPEHQDQQRLLFAPLAEPSL